MCGRYQFSVGRSEDLLRIARDTQRLSGEGAQPPLPDGDVCPAQRAPVLVSRGGKVVSELQTWGLPGPNGRLIINARAETVTQKSLFRRSIAARRCVVPATAFYERDAARRAYTFSLPDSPLWLAGIYDNVDGEDRFVILTPRFTPSCTDALMEQLGRIAAERGLYVQSHLSENRGEMAWVRELCPDCGQYWETYAKHGLWKSHTIMAHCVHSDEREQRAMAEAEVLAVHCADSNVSLCSGTAPVREMLERGVWVALGSDVAGGAILGMNDAITASIRASKIKSMETGAAFLTVPEGYYLGTTAGHRYFGVGAGFAAGDRLHAIVVDESRFPEPVRALSLSERLERALYLMDSRDIRAVYSDGRKVLG